MREYIRALIARARCNDKALKVHYSWPKNQRVRHRKATLARLTAARLMREDIAYAFARRHKQAPPPNGGLVSLSSLLGVLTIYGL